VSDPISIAGVRFAFTRGCCRWRVALLDSELAMDHPGRDFGALLRRA
jgi:hypothetical protein